MRHRERLRERHRERGEERDGGGGGTKRGERWWRRETDSDEGKRQRGKEIQRE